VERRRSAEVHSEAESARRHAEEANRALAEAQKLLEEFQQQASDAALLRDELNGRTEEWQRERAELSAQLETAQTATVTLESFSQERLVELEGMNASLQERLEGAAADAAQLRDELHARTEEWQRERVELSAQLETARTAAATLESFSQERLVELEGWNASLQERLQGAAADAAQLRDELNARTEEWQRERAELSAQLETARAATVTLETFSSAQERLVELEGLNASLQERLQGSADETNLAREKAGYWEQESARREAESAESANERDSLKHRIEELECELQRAQEAAERALQQAASSSPGEHVHHERDSWEAELNDLRRELEETRHSLRAERDDLQVQLAAAQEASAVRVSPEEFQAERREWEQLLADLKAELEQVQRSRDVERARHENELADLRRAIAEKTAEKSVEPLAPAAPREEEQLGAAEIERERNQLKRQREAQEREIDETREQLARFKAKLEERSQALDARETELKDQAARLEQATRASEIAASASPPSHEGGAQAPEQAPEFLGTLVLPRRESIDVPNSPATRQESVAELLARMGQAPEWLEEEQGAAAIPQPTPTTPVAASAGVPAAAAPEHSSENDESIEDYMSRLLQRVRGDDVASSYRAPTPTVRSNPPPSRPVPTPKAETASPAEADAASSRPMSDTMSAEEFVPRSQAPEGSERMAAMRDLANTTARSAIVRHTRTQWLGRTLIRLGLAAGAAAACVVLILFFAGGTQAALPGAVLAAGASVYWAMRTIRNSKELVRTRRPKAAETQPGN
jgi:chromosome segregation ATPase